MWCVPCRARAPCACCPALLKSNLEAANAMVPESGTEREKERERRCKRGTKKIFLFKGRRDLKGKEGHCALSCLSVRAFASWF